MMSMCICIHVRIKHFLSSLIKFRSFFMYILMDNLQNQYGKSNCFCYFILFKYKILTPVYMYRYVDTCTCQPNPTNHPRLRILARYYYLEAANELAWRQITWHFDFETVVVSHYCPSYLLFSRPSAS